MANFKDDFWGVLVHVLYAQNLDGGSFHVQQFMAELDTTMTHIMNVINQNQ